MLISAVQQEANLRNAQQSTGPQTPEGKQAVRLNALKHGLRARCTVLPFEDPDAFAQLHTGLEAEWQPQTATQRLFVQQMAIHQWLLIRLTNFERSVYAGPMDAAAQMAILERFSTQRARLENAFAKTLRDLIALQKHQPKAAEKPVQPRQHPEPPEYKPLPPQPSGTVYVMSQDTR